MSDRSSIEWTDATWNVVTGCTKVSEGCRNCYITRTPPFRMHHRRWDRDGIGATTDVQLHPDRLSQPNRWRKPRRVFVCSLADLFHDQVPDDHIVRVWAAMATTERHTYQLLTKRPARMRALLRDPGFRSAVADLAGQIMEDGDTWHDYVARGGPWPLPNIWGGVTAEDQDRADQRIPILLDTPLAVRWVSVEPMLATMNLTKYLRCQDCEWTPSGNFANPCAAHRCPDCGHMRHDADECCHPDPGTGWCECATETSFPSDDRALSWVVAGGESGPGARPMHPDWVRGLRDQCQAAGVPLCFKQWGNWCQPDQLPDDSFRVWEQGADDLRTDRPVRFLSPKFTGRLLDGQVWDQYPEADR